MRSRSKPTPAAFVLVAAVTSFPFRHPRSRGAWRHADDNPGA